MANLDDVVTSTKNAVQAINALAKELLSLRTDYEQVIGTNSALGITTTTLISTTSGRCVAFSVNALGGAVGTIHDAASVSSATVDNIIATIPTAVTTGIITVNFPFTNGLVVKPGSNHNVSVVYS